MKYINLQTLKVLWLITVLFIGHSTVIAQDEQYDHLSSEDYQLINDFYSLREGDQPKKIYYRTYFDKGWTGFFTDIDAVLKQGGGLGTTVSDEELKQILTGNILRKIRNEIDIAIPLQLNSRKLSDKIELVKSFDSKQALKDGVVRITNPVLTPIKQEYSFKFRCLI